MAVAKSGLGQDEGPGIAMGVQAVTREGHDLLENKGLALTRAPTIEYTPSGYVFEQHDIEL